MPTDGGSSGGPVRWYVGGEGKYPGSTWCGYRNAKDSKGLRRPNDKLKGLGSEGGTTAGVAADAAGLRYGL